MNSDARVLISQNVDLTQELMKLRAQHAKDTKELESLRTLVKEYRKNAKYRYERDKGHSAKLSDIVIELMMAGAAVITLQVLSYIIFEVWMLIKGI